jgi:hypothetical protein
VIPWNTVVGLTCRVKWGKLYCRIVPITGVSRKWKALEKLDLCRPVAAEVIRTFV